MSEHEYVESIEPAGDGLTERDEADLARLLSEPDAPKYHPILKVWQEILKPENLDANREITMRWATNIVAKHMGVGFSDLTAFRDRYFELLDDCVQILHDEIADDEKALSYDNAEDDRELNGEHYRNILRDWQLRFLTAELGEWHHLSENAAVDVAALAEAHAVFFGPTALTSYLEAIKFEYTEADSQALAEALEEKKAELTGASGE